MTHALDPTRLAGDRDYAAALDELEELMLADPDTPAGLRFDELVHLIEEYEARQWPAELSGCWSNQKRPLLRVSRWWSSKP